VWQYLHFMKQRIVLIVVALLLLWLTYDLGYRSGYSRARQSVPVIVARDVNDSPQASTTVGQKDPYYKTANSIPESVR